MQVAFAGGAGHASAAAGWAAAMAQDFSFMTHTAPLWRTGGPQVMLAARTLRKLCANVVDSPGILKYRRVRMAKVDSLLPEALLVHCGFSKLTYPDGDYWVMHNVDEALLRSVVKELDLALSTAQSLCDPSVSEREAPAHTQLTSKENDGLRDLEPTPTQSEVKAPSGASTAPVAQSETLTDLQRLQTAATKAPSLECQLRARSAAHKLSPMTTPSLLSTHRAAVGAVCATGLALLAAWVGAYSGEV